jgi:hypothetical protein
MNRIDRAYIVSGHSEITGTTQIFKVPTGVTFLSVSKCGRTTNALKNSLLSNKLRGFNRLGNFVSRALNTGGDYSVFLPGEMISDVMLETRPQNSRDTMFHGLISLPLGVGENLSRKNTINRPVAFANSRLKLSSLLNELKKHTRNDSILVIGNFCGGIKGLNINNASGLIKITNNQGKNQILRTRPGETVENAIRRAMGNGNRRRLSNYSLGILRLYEYEKLLHKRGRGNSASNSMQVNLTPEEFVRTAPPLLNTKPRVPINIRNSLSGMPNSFIRELAKNAGINVNNATKKSTLVEILASIYANMRLNK